jgi:hypothetical protein
MTQGQAEAAASKRPLANQFGEAQLGLWLQLTVRRINAPGSRLGVRARVMPKPR